MRNIWANVRMQAILPDWIHLYTINIIWILLTYQDLLASSRADWCRAVDMMGKIGPDHPFPVICRSRVHNQSAFASTNPAIGVKLSWALYSDSGPRDDGNKNRCRGSWKTNTHIYFSRECIICEPSKLLIKAHGGCFAFHGINIEVIQGPKRKCWLWILVGGRKQPLSKELHG